MARKTNRIYLIFKQWRSGTICLATVCYCIGESIQMHDSWIELTFLILVCRYSVWKFWSRKFICHNRKQQIWNRWKNTSPIIWVSDAFKISRFFQNSLYLPHSLQDRQNRRYLCNIMHPPRAARTISTSFSLLSLNHFSWRETRQAGCVSIRLGSRHVRQKELWISPRDRECACTQLLLIDYLVRK